jgi:hypothetical protein
MPEHWLKQADLGEYDLENKNEASSLIIKAANVVAPNNAGLFIKKAVNTFIAGTPQ